jgi:tRNA(Ile)-lysidine synthase
MAEVVDPIQRAVAGGMPPAGPVVLAVSGGVDSMVLLDAAAARVDAGRLHVATFDHGTGAFATGAAATVVRRARELGVAVHPGAAAEDLPSSEGAWRDARWEFLRAVARRVGGPVATAHTRDDQVETVFLRAVRGAGARGLAGLRAGGGVLRPLLSIRRVDIERYATARGLGWYRDPSNATPKYTRNRARLEILPALRAAHPTIDDDLLAIGDRAFEWREEVDVCVSGLLGTGPVLDIPVLALANVPAAAMPVVWPALLARAGCIMDRRGIARVADFAVRGAVGRSVQLSGGWTLTRRRATFELRRTPLYMKARLNALGRELSALDSKSSG